MRGLLMGAFMLLVSIQVTSSRVGGRSKNSEDDIYIAGFFPLSHDLDEGIIGRGVIPAVRLAIRDVNANENLLQGYRLHIVYNDTKCNTAWGTKTFFDAMHQPPMKLALFGAACTHVTDPIAMASKFWHILQLSYADTHPMFSKAKYPNFFRIVPSETEFNFAHLGLLKHFNWTKVGTLYQNQPRFALAANNLEVILDSYGFEVAESQGFVNDVATALLKLRDKNKDIRIIIGSFNETFARRVFCQAYQLGLYGGNYQWIIAGLYGDRWWEKEGEKDWEVACTRSEILEALNGCFIADLLPLRTDNMITVAQRTSMEYEREYHRERHREYSRFHGYAYDGVWALALVIHAVTQKILRLSAKDGRSLLSLKDFTYRSPFWGKLFQEAIEELRFEGVTGLVNFTDNSRKGLIVIKQFQEDHEVKVGEWDGRTETLDLSRGEGTLLWRHGKPPRDRTLKIIVPTRVNITIYSVLVVIACLGIVMACYFLAVNTKYRHQRYIKMSSPYLNNLIILGCILTYSSVIFLGLDSQLTSVHSFPYICTARAWFLMAGFTLAFGSMFSKTWRVHAIFTDIKLNKKVIKDYQLFMVVGVLLAIDIAIMTTWQIVDPFTRDTKQLGAYIDPSDKDREIVPENEYCKSVHMTVFVSCIYGYKGLLMVFGCFLAWETRHVSIAALNDSKYIGMSVYNVVIMCVLGAPISFVLSDQQDAAFIMIALFIIFCSSTTLCLVFLPKLIQLRKNPTGKEDKKVRATLKPPRGSRRDSEEDEEILKGIQSARTVHNRLRNTLEDQQALIVKLLNEAGEEAGGYMNEYTSKRPEKPARKKVTYFDVDAEPESTSSLNSRDGELAPLNRTPFRREGYKSTMALGLEVIPTGDSLSVSFQHGSPPGGIGEVKTSVTNLSESESEQGEMNRVEVELHPVKPPEKGEEPESPTSSEEFSYNHLSDQSPDVIPVPKTTSSRSSSTSPAPLDVVDEALSERRHEVVGHSNSWDLGITEGERDSPPLRTRGLSFSNPGEKDESRSKRSSALLSPSGKPKSCSGDILAHSEELNILPIFHKLLSKRKETPGGFSGASCPNIIIKCDIVEYL